MEQPIVWTTEKRTVESLVPWARNPRKITEARMGKLQKSLAKFGYASEILANLDGQMIAGHMRLRAMVLLKMVTPEDEIDVRLPSRMLKKGEVEELAIRDNGNFGEWDFDILNEDFEIPQLLDFGFEPVELGIENPGGSKEDKKAPGTVIKYEIIFDGEGQQERWHRFVARLKDIYPEEETIAARLDGYLRETVGLP